MHILLGFAGVLLTFAVLSGLGYAIVNKKLNLRVAIVLVAIVLIVGGLWRSWGAFGTPSLSLQSPSLKTVWAMTQSYWLWIFLTGCIAYVLLSFISKEKETTAKKLQVLLVLVMVMLFIGFPLIEWVAGFGGSREQKQTEKALPTLSMPASGDSSRISPPVGHAVTFTTGTGFTAHYVYADGREGTVGDPTSPHEDGHIVAVYVRDTTGRPNSVTYEFVRPK